MKILFLAENNFFVFLATQGERLPAGTGFKPIAILFPASCHGMYV